MESLSSIKRISVTPVSLIAAAHQAQNPVKMAKALERAAQSTGAISWAATPLWCRRALPRDYA